MFGGNFAPVGWELCKGQTLPISENDTLFNLIGTTYGGDGEETFNLPNLQGQIPIHKGQGIGLGSYQIGQSGGVESVTLSSQQMPQHNHALLASTEGATETNPQGNVLGSPPSITMFLRANPNVPMAATMVQPVGGSQPHENRMPYLTINFIISLFGVFPSPS